jgi:cytochrome o ubiquinol oxidase operon protein cyoD
MDKEFRIISTQYHLGRNTLKLYVTGFVLSLFLTVVPYLLVVNDALTAKNLVLTIVVLGLAQLAVQVVFFLHLSTKRWNLIVFIFTIFVVAILVGGSLWIMYNLKYNMASSTPVDANAYMQSQREGYIPQ